MAAGEQRYQRLLDDFLLAEDDFADTLADQSEPLPESLDFGDQIGRTGVQGCGGIHAVGSLLARAPRETDGNLRSGQTPPCCAIRSPAASRAARARYAHRAGR